MVLEAQAIQAIQAIRAIQETLALVVVEVAAVSLLAFVLAQLTQEMRTRTLIQVISFLPLQFLVVGHWEAETPLAEQLHFLATQGKLDNLDLLDLRDLRAILATQGNLPRVWVTALQEGLAETQDRLETPVTAVGVDQEGQAGMLFQDLAYVLDSRVMVEPVALEAVMVVQGQTTKEVYFKVVVHLGILVVAAEAGQAP